MYTQPSDLVLSLYPSTRGFGYVLFEGPLSPFDWGVKEIRGAAKNRRILKFLESLLDRYKPGLYYSMVKRWTIGMSIIKGKLLPNGLLLKEKYFAIQIVLIALVI